ncbi:enoyl-CoA hydratase-related protein [Ferruginivarius sediminum]|uniref:Enoyl-CoA hydratase/isomerase family protein n=1 Tax=Ferruginivarius sediminum TaxID=2661937 RepID=A0A369TC48_9PROT|nr:enoyl-CoA hydratase-related protein [Ferruginivarius sediminum]RDD62889.1 enoyl-CoA hydratase/isomerase family protein [Ferruginivarius sediminum]
MDRPLFLEEIDEEGVAHIALTRPDKHNAFNAELIAELTSALQGLDDDPRVRCLALTSEGQSFSAGADLAWMKSMADASEEDNLHDARALAGLAETLDAFSKPTVALVQGAAIGGGMGLVACCDIAVAAQSAFFALSEVRLGLIPAVIQPYVVSAIGHRATRYYTLTGERFEAAVALRLGLVHKVVPDDDLQAAGRKIVDSVLKGGPYAQGEAKSQLRALRGYMGTPEAREDAAHRIARLRVGDEGQEGIAAFLEKRKPWWQAD